jgi:peptidoglycan hydrolase-like protein with peptidoglycan-binding domain
MQRIRSAAWVGIAAALLGASSAAQASAASTRALESIRVSNTSTTPVKTQTVLQAGHRYRLGVTGTVSDWCPPTATKQSDCSYGSPLDVGKGVDAVWCYATWRCAAKEAWQQLNVNGRGILDFAGLTSDKVPYSAGHSYTFEFDGVSGALTLGAGDALAGSTGDNSGGFNVTITDLGGSGGGDEAGPASAATKRLQQRLAQLGYYNGPQDGRDSARLRDALKRFQLQAGIPADGRCDDDACEAAIRKALGIGVSPAVRSVSDLQADLKRLGLYNGPVDGKGGPSLDAAVKTFQRDVGIPADGECGARCRSSLNRALGLDDPALPAGAAPTTPKTVVQLQTDLKHLGFYTGPLDGKAGGPLLDAAVKDFQHGAGIAADGKCGARCQHELVKALGT